MDDWRTSSVFLGISVGANSYTRDNFSAYLAWAKLHSSDFAVLIGDDIYALSHSVFHRCSLFHSMRIAREKGQDIARSTRRLATAAGVPTTLFHWRDLITLPPYRHIKKVAVDLYERDRRFASLVREEVLGNLEHRLEKQPIEESPQSPRLWRRLDSYVLHEIAGLITISEHCGYATEIYPGSDVRVLSEIYAGAFPSLKRLLPDKPRRRFQSLDFD